MKKILILGLLASLMTQVSFGADDTKTFIDQVGLPLAATAARTFLPELFSLEHLLDEKAAVKNFAETILGKTSWKTATDAELQSFLNSITDPNIQINETLVRQYLTNNSKAKKLADSNLTDVLLSRNPTVEVAAQAANIFLGSEQAKKDKETLGGIYNKAQKFIEKAKK